MAEHEPCAADSDSLVVGKAPGHGVVLVGMGDIANAALAASGLGFFVPCQRAAAAPTLEAAE